MKSLIRRGKDGWRERFFGLKNWMFGWDDQLLLEKDAAWKKIGNQNFQIDDYKKKFSVKAELPGYSGKDINVKAEKGVVRIEAKMETKRKESKNGCYRYENNYQAIRGSFALPKEADVRTLKTSFHNGRLEIDLAKKQAK